MMHLYERACAAVSFHGPPVACVTLIFARLMRSNREAPPSPESSGMTSSSTAPTTDGKSASPSTLSGASPFNFGPDVAAGISSIQSARDYDWTYSTTWPGFPSSSSASPSPTLGLSRTDSVQALLSPEEKPTPWFVPASDPGGRDRIPVEKLGAREPILFYDELVLFEDELADNGSSMVVVKVVSVLTRAGSRIGFRVLTSRTTFLPSTCKNSASCHPVSWSCNVSSCA